MARQRREQGAVHYVCEGQQGLALLLRVSYCVLVAAVNCIGYRLC